MSTPAGIDEISALSDADLGARLSRLEREERQVSKRRTTLHNRIDFVRAGGFASTDPAHEQLSTLEATEHEISERRLELHRQIDALHAEIRRRSLRR